jgi:hypothetical protein
VRRKGEIVHRRFDTLTMPISRANSPGIGWGDKAKPSAFSFVGGFAV